MPIQLSVSALAGRRRLRIAAAAVPLVLAAALSGPVAAHASTSNCPPWTHTQPPNPNPDDSELDGIAVAGCDAWAVGEFEVGDTVNALIEHWNGSWQVAPSPDPGPGELSAVSAASASDVWATGSFFNADEHKDDGLIEHWDGTGWTQRQSPNPGGFQNDLLGVSAVSATAAWAVGYASADDDKGGPDVPLILHWDGTNWNTQVPAPTVRDSELDAVSADSPNDAWAVGVSGNDIEAGPVSVAMHYDGTGWNPVHVPFNGALIGVSAISPTDVWAVGGAILHWDGTQWTSVASAPGLPANFVAKAISATSDSDVWVAGEYRSSDQPLLAHWNGSAWTQVSMPSEGVGGNTNALSVSAGVGWIAGSQAGVSNGAQGKAPRTTFAAPFITVPNVLGRIPALADAAVRGASLTSNITTTASCGVASNGQVVDTSPGAGQMVPINSVVNLTVCRPNATVPNVVGSSAADAQTALANSHLGFTTTGTEQCGLDSGGQVTAASPSAGSVVPVETAVALTVCNATETVPSVLTFDDTSAENAIRAAHLRVGSVTAVPNCNVSAGDVVGQGPLGGNSVARGSSVSLTESNGRQANGKPCTRN